MKKYYEEIDILKGMAILLVLLGHAILVYPINFIENYRWCSILHDYIYSFHMPLFFIISGFLYKDGNTYVKYTYTKFVYKKINRLLIPYVMMSILDFIPRILKPDIVNKSSSNYLKSMLLYGGSYWFVYTLFFIFLMTPIYEIIYKKINSYILTQILVIFIFYNIRTINYFLLGSTVYFIFYFLLGEAVRVNYDTYKKLCDKLVFIVTLILFITMGLYKNNNLFMEFFIPITGSIMFYYISTLVQRCKLVKLKKYLILSGKYSLQLYLLNGFLLVASRYIQINLLHFTNPIIIVINNFLVTFLGGIFITRIFISKYKVFRYMFGI